MRYQWDPAKARSNLSKHGVEFAEAVAVFEDPLTLTLDDPHPTEERFLSLGQDMLGRIIVVNWTARGESIRLFSARNATPAERRQYKEGLDHA